MANITCEHCAREGLPRIPGLKAMRIPVVHCWSADPEDRDVEPCPEGRAPGDGFVPVTSNPLDHQREVWQDDSLWDL